MIPVIVVACMLILFWLLVSYFQAQQALQWWYSRQAAQLCHQAEDIRNGLLQESFMLRRSLELSLANREQSLAATEQDCLATIEHFHHSLKELSDHLSPPYLDDSLPLAIQAQLERWKSHHPLCQFSWDLPANWHSESPDRSRLVLAALDELLRLTVTEVTQISIVVRLNPSATTDELAVQFTHLNASDLNTFELNASSQIALQQNTAEQSQFTNFNDGRELRYLRRAFRFLSFGECFRRQEPEKMTWYFRWRVPRQPGCPQRNAV